MDYSKYEHKLPYATPSKDRGVWEAYLKEEQQIMSQFKQDLFIELDIENNPKREKLFSIAWDYAHSSGYSEVFNCAEELVDLIL